MAQTSDDDMFWLKTDSAGGEMEENVHHTSSPTPSGPDRYLKQAKSAHGKVAYVVYAGNEVGVFYNWYAFISFCEI